MLNCKLAVFRFALILFIATSSFTFHIAEADVNDSKQSEYQRNAANEQQILQQSIKDALYDSIYHLEIISQQVEFTRNSTHAMAKRLIDLRKITSIGFALILALLLVIVFQLRSIAKGLSGDRLTSELAESEIASAPEPVDGESTPVSRVELMVISILLFSIVTIAIIYVAL